MYGSYIDEPVMMQVDSNNSSTQYYFGQTTNMNTEVVFDDQGDVVERYEIGPFGDFKVYDGMTNTELTASKVGNEYVVQGRRFDSEVNLYYFRNRYYSPEMERFVSRDPLRFRAGDINLYRFVGNGPFGGLDPMGLMKKRSFDFSRGVLDVSLYSQNPRMNVYARGGVQMLSQWKLRDLDKCLKNCKEIRFKQTVDYSTTPRCGNTSFPYNDPCDKDQDYYYSDKDYQDKYDSQKMSIRDNPIMNLSDGGASVWIATTKAFCITKGGGEEYLGEFTWGYAFTPSEYEYGFWNGISFE